MGRKRLLGSQRKPDLYRYLRRVSFRQPPAQECERGQYEKMATQRPFD